MKIKAISAKLPEYLQELKNEEKAENTIKAYERDLKGFFKAMDGEAELQRSDVATYKQELKDAGAAASTINRKIVSINKYLKWAGADDAAGTKQIKTQGRATLENVISKSEYERLLRAANNPQGQAKAAGLKQDKQLVMVMQTIAGTGIRFNELQYFTVENIKAAKRSGHITVENKGKQRSVPVPRTLSKELLNYCSDQGIESSYIFGTSKGNPISNAQLTKRLKRIAGYARVSKERAHWHNFRHLFAKEYMEKVGRIDALQDILGHSSINTTTIYTKLSAKERAEQVETLDIVRPLSSLK